MRTLVIVNPAAGNGRTRSAWPDLRPRVEASLGTVSVACTRSPGDATRRTHQALRDGVDRIVAVGGDGTLNEVVNGFFCNGAPLRPNAVLTPLPLGTGSDFCRMLGLSPGTALDTAASVLDRPRIRPVDLGRARFVADDGTPAARWFLNVASFGLGGAVTHLVDRLPLPPGLGGGARYLAAILCGLVTSGTHRVSVTVDDAAWDLLAVREVAIANGAYVGGGLRIAPTAQVDDGWLDVVSVGALPVSTLLRHAVRFYRGAHLGLDGVRFARGRRIEACPAPTPNGGTGSAPHDAVVPLQLDGEPVGRLPATFTVVPGALRVQG